MAVTLQAHSFRIPGYPFTISHFTPLRVSVTQLYPHNQAQVYGYGLLLKRLNAHSPRFSGFIYGTWSLIFFMITETISYTSH